MTISNRSRDSSIPGDCKKLPFCRFGRSYCFGPRGTYLAANFASQVSRWPKLRQKPANIDLISRKQCSHFQPAVKRQKKRSVWQYIALFSISELHPHEPFNGKNNDGRFLRRLHRRQKTPTSSRELSGMTVVRAEIWNFAQSFAQLRFFYTGSKLYNLQRFYNRQNTHIWRIQFLLGRILCETYWKGVTWGLGHVPPRLPEKHSAGVDFPHQGTILKTTLECFIREWTTLTLNK